MDIIYRFSQYLDSVEYPKEKTSWNIAGIIKGQNAFYKFDVRDMFKLTNGDMAQRGTIQSKADKMVLEYKEKWIVLDLEELHKYLQENKKTRVYVEELIDVLEWNIVIDK
jgi:hypothetical protein